MEKTKAYIVITEGDVEGRTSKTLGYATGEPFHIQAYFEDKKYYAIHLSPIEILHITKADVDEKSALLKRKQALESELDDINRKL